MYFEDRDERELFDYDSALKLEDLNGTTNRKILNLIKATKSFNEGITAGTEIKKSQSKKAEGPSEDKKHSATLKMMKGKGKGQSSFKPLGADQDFIEEEDESGDSETSEESDSQDMKEEKEDEKESDSSQLKTRNRLARSRSLSEVSSRKSQGGPPKDLNESMSKNESNPSLDESHMSKPNPKLERDRSFKVLNLPKDLPEPTSGRKTNQRLFLPTGGKTNLLSPNINHGGKHLLVPPLHQQRNSTS